MTRQFWQLLAAIIKDVRLRDSFGRVFTITGATVDGRLCLTRVDERMAHAWEVESLDGFEVQDRHGNWVRIGND